MVYRAQVTSLLFVCRTRTTGHLLGWILCQDFAPQTQRHQDSTRKQQRPIRHVATPKGVADPNLFRSNRSLRRARDQRVYRRRRTWRCRARHRQGEMDRSSWIIEKHNSFVAIFRRLRSRRRGHFPPWSTRAGVQAFGVYCAIYLVLQVTLHSY